MRVFLSRLAAAALAASALCGGGAMAADSYPARPIRLIVPFPPGGSNDIVGRVIGAVARSLAGLHFIVNLIRKGGWSVYDGVRGCGNRFEERL